MRPFKRKPKQPTTREVFYDQIKVWTKGSDNPFYIEFLQDSKKLKKYCEELKKLTGWFNTPNKSIKRSEIQGFIIRKLKVDEKIEKNN